MAAKTDADVDGEPDDTTATTTTGSAPDVHYSHVLARSLTRLYARSIAPLLLPTLRSRSPLAFRIVVGREGGEIRVEFAYRVSLSPLTTAVRAEAARAVGRNAPEHNRNRESREVNEVTLLPTASA